METGDENFDLKLNRLQGQLFLPLSLNVKLLQDLYETNFMRILARQKSMHRANAPINIRDKSRAIEVSD